jgi:hypothetical protein
LGFAWLGHCTESWRAEVCLATPQQFLASAGEGRKGAGTQDFDPGRTPAVTGEFGDRDLRFL